MTIKIDRAAEYQVSGETMCNVLGYLVKQEWQVVDGLIQELAESPQINEEQDHGSDNSDGGDG